MNKSNSTSHPIPSDYETTISLLSVYFSEWSHRDQILWSQIYKFFYAILVVILLPNISSFLQIDLPDIPTEFFCLCGLILSILFLYVSFGYLKRLEASGKTYSKIIETLPPEYQRISLRDLRHGVLFTPRTSYFICFTLFLILCSLSLILLLI